MEWGRSGGEECGGTLEGLMGAREAPTRALEWSTDARKGFTGTLEGSVDTLEFLTGALEGFPRTLESRPGTREWTTGAHGRSTGEREPVTRGVRGAADTDDGSGRRYGLAINMRVPGIGGVGEDLDESHGATIR